MQSEQRVQSEHHLSFFKPIGYQKNRCGYCKQEASNSSYYAISERVLPKHYQALVDRGWRRSGTLYYKQDLTRSCCPHYAIRLDAKSFRPRKDQRHAINRWNRFILGQDYIRKAARLCPKTRQEKNRRRNHFDLESSVHASEYSEIKRPTDPKTNQPIEPAHKFEVTLEADTYSQEKWDLFIRYQTTVHKEPSSKWKRADFDHFLCSGMDRSGSGASHDDRKLAVLDLLPHGVSSVYLIYDPDLAQWEFGKLSALHEIALTIEGGYQYYYMGFYIHSCVKMRYKGDYHAQYILDPESLEWDLLDDSYKKKLGKRKYVSLSGDRKRGIPDDEQAIEAQNTSICEGENSEKSTVKSDATGNMSESVDKIESEESGSENMNGKESEDAWEIPDCSLFDLNVPGVLTKEEVEMLNLDYWLLHNRGLFARMKDLVGWDTSNITDPRSAKGIIGELAAVLGPEVVKESAVEVF